MLNTSIRYFMKHCLRVLFCLAGLSSLGCGGGGGSTPPQPNPTPVTPAVIAWLQQTAKPFSSTEPTTADADLAFVDVLTGDTAIVGMGEATHGSSEFQKMKHRMFRYLVEHKGVTAFGLESNMGRCLAIDQYVLTGQGDPTQALKGQGPWPWITQEMIDLVNWMRSYNNDSTHLQKLHFFGFDMQDGGVEMDQVLAYLQPIDPQAATNLTQLFAPYRPFTYDGGLNNYFTASASVHTQCHTNIQQAYQWMVDHQSTYSLATGLEAYAWALQMAKVVMQNEAMNAADPNSLTLTSLNTRDQAMADNVDWYVQQLGVGAKVVLSAHNGHINKKGTNPAYTNTGDWLSQRHGAGYLSIGFAFDTGSFNAMVLNSAGTSYNLQSNSVPPASSGSYEDAFVQAGLNLAFLDMRNLDYTQPGPAWLDQPHSLRELDAIWSNTPGYGTGSTLLPYRFDTVIFIKTVTATTLLN
jgi:erythromycin esterase